MIRGEMRVFEEENVGLAAKQKPERVSCRGEHGRN